MEASNKNQLLVRPMLLLSIVVSSVLIFSTVALVHSFDRETVLREREMIDNGIGGRATELATALAPQVVWADAVRNLDNRFDPAWAKINIVDYLSDMSGFEEIYILDAAGRPLLAAKHQQVVSILRYDQLADQVSPLLIEIRAGELKRQRDIQQNGGKPIKTPIQSTAIVTINGAAHILVASRVQPDFSDNHLRGIHAPIVLAAKRIDAGFLDAFGKRFLLRGLRISSPSAPSANDEEQTQLRNPAGRTVAVLSWQPQSPGKSLITRMAPAIGLFSGLLILLIAMLLRRSKRMAQGLVTSEARAAHLAYYDALTGLANRVQFNDRLASQLVQLRRNAKRFAVHCIDLDRFKDINDTYGHAVGDELLRMASERMATVLRDGDTIARLSGDEFAIIQHTSTPASSARLAERLRSQMEAPFQCSAAQLTVGCSIGITIVTDGKLDPAEVLRQADIALYRAKESAKGRHCFFEVEMDVLLKQRRILEEDLRLALVQGDLRLAYQPQFNIKRQIVGVEALVRWRHPQRGELSPAYFVPVAEQAGLIQALGDFTLRAAFADSKRWTGLKVAINISASQIRDASFVGRLADMVDISGINPNDFDLEITEGILLGDDPDTHGRLAKLREMGFGLALDDFGTGYSSLSYLHRYPINKIKIDRSFIANIGVTGEAEAVIGAIVSLAQALNLGVIAEGVETEAQLYKVTRAGCNVIQGFLFSEAVSAEQVAINWPASAALRQAVLVH